MGGSLTGCVESWSYNMGTDIGNIIGLLLQNQYGKKAPRAPLFAQTPEPGYERALSE